VKLAEVKPLIDKLVSDLCLTSDVSIEGAEDEDEIRIALESAFVAGVRSGLKYTSNAKFAELFGGKRSDK
jgi:hypothetical protein